VAQRVGRDIALHFHDLGIIRGEWSAHLVLGLHVSFLPSET
jgi:hypothetical protein